jgi:hypothetical protein
MSRHHNNELEELRNRIRELAYFLLGEEFMSQVQFTVAITVAPTSTPVQEGSSSGSADFTQNVQGSITLTPITGGVPPYTASVDAASPSQLPPGITASIDPNNNLILSGTPTVAGSASVLLDVVDSLGASVASVKANVKS